MTLCFEDPPFVVIEGLDGAGTTTQARLLVEGLQEVGQPAHLSREPSDGPIGVLIRQMLARRVVVPQGDGYAPIGRQTLALLFAADRLDHVRAEVEPALAAGAVAVSDRYYHSSLVYQGDVDDQDEMDLRWVRAINERARVPDLTIFLQAPAELCLGRIASRSRRDLYETEAKLRRLEQRYDEVISAMEEDGEAIVRLDAARRPEELAAEIRERVVALGRVGSG